MKNGFTTLFLFTFLMVTSLGLRAQEKDPTQLINEMETAMGGWNKLYALQDVEFHYDYAYPGQGLKDVSTERYIFEGEHSWAKYTRHQINVMKDAKGTVVQCYNGKGAEVALNGKKIEQPEVVGGAYFLRKANYFWFVMMFKLDDPGTNHRYLGTESLNGIAYDKVAVSYDATVTGKEQNDAYVLYINPKTKLVDQFLFSLPAMGVNEPVLKMRVEYTEMHGLQLPLKRYAYQPGPDGKYGEAFLVQTSTQVKFNNGFEAKDLSLD